MEVVHCTGRGCTETQRRHTQVRGHYRGNKDRGPGDQKSCRTLLEVKIDLRPKSYAINDDGALCVKIRITPSKGTFLLGIA